jgi:hypothetical protein
VPGGRRFRNRISSKIFYRVKSADNYRSEIKESWEWQVKI